MNFKVLLRKHRSTAFLILGLLAVRWSFAEPYHVPTGSMEPTIMPGDRIVANKLAFGLRVPFTKWKPFGAEAPKRGDIVVFKYPVDPKITFVKRLIGLPGDHIEVDSGFISVNGHLLDGSATALQNTPDPTGLHYQESYGTHHYTVQRLALDHRHLTFEVPKGSYFFMGDNRDNSSDSRFWGFVPEENLLGKAMFVAFHLKWDHLIPTVNVQRIATVLDQ